MFYGQTSRKFPSNIQRRAKMRLNSLDAALVLTDLRHPPSHHLEALKGDRQGQHSIRVNNQWRICFIWRGGNAYEVAMVDYH